MGAKDFLDNWKQYISGDVAQDIDERVEQLLGFQNLEGSEYDAFGASRKSLSEIMKRVYFFYRFYFRTEVHGLENVAGLERALIIPNHMVQTPVDGMNIGAALFFEPDQPRLIRAIGHYVLADNPFISMFVARSGQVIGNEANADRVFEEDNHVLIFPEGSGAIRPYHRRYRLNKFSPGFIEYAIKYDYPVIPTAVIGSEESTMILAQVPALDGFMNIPRFGVSPTFPLLGPLGLIPYPVRFRLYFGEPMNFSDHKDKIGDPKAIRRLVEEVRLTLQKMLEQKLRDLPRMAFL